MSSTSERDALAADLLADLATPPVAAPVPEADDESDADDSRTRGPGLETVLRLAPFDWYRPQLRIQLLAVSVHAGPVYAKLGVRRGNH